jgi:putative SOS response-associated peptidase YedK
MCGRYVLVSDLSVIAEEFEVDMAAAAHCAYTPSWGVFPGQDAMAVVRWDGRNELVSLHWGLIPGWARDPAIGGRMFNARAETVETKPSFRSAFRKRRCLIAADGFYEWKMEGKKKVPAYFHLKSGRPFGFAGLFETWRGPDQTEIHSCTIITTEPNALIRPIHDRMPVIVPGDRQHVWLDGRIEDPKALLPILAPYPAEAMDFKWGLGPAFA